MLTSVTLYNINNSSKMYMGEPVRLLSRFLFSMTLLCGALPSLAQTAPRDSIIAAGNSVTGVHAQPSLPETSAPVSSVLAPPHKLAPQEDPHSYWTPERMRNAKPMERTSDSLSHGVPALLRHCTVCKPKGKTFICECQ